MKYLAPYLFLALALSLSTSSAFDCPSGVTGYYADPEDCANYYRCVAGHPKPYFFVCPANTVYDDKSTACNYETMVDCGNRPTDGDNGNTINDPSTTTKATTIAQATTTRKPTTTKAATTRRPTTMAPGAAKVLPAKMMGLYLSVTADNVPGYTTADEWTPELYPYQQTSANVLFLTFINPETMEVPRAFANLAATRGTGAPGSVPSDTIILFAIAGYAYSQNIDPFYWLETREAAEAMAAKVATWTTTYPGCDGVDLDIEEGAGQKAAAAVNVVYFVQKLRELNPTMIITQPAYGYPLVPAANTVINAAWDSSNNLGLVDAMGIMFYTGTGSLNYVDNYAAGTNQDIGFPITVDVARPDILLGCKGTASAADYVALAKEAMKQDLRGIMVWYATVRNGHKYMYDATWDASIDSKSQGSMGDAYQILMSASV